MSSVLHTDGRLIFALTTIFFASSKSTSLSTYVWHTPIPPATTGILDLFLTRLINPEPPLGMTRSI